MTRPIRHPIRTGLLALAAGLVVGAGPALAQGGGGNSSSGSGLSPGASASGNDRSAGVNNGNYRPPGSYGTYGRRGYYRPSYERPRRYRPYRDYRY